jgi:hypothetical protein
MSVHTELFSGEDETLLVWWNAFLILNLGFDVIDRVARLHLEGDCLAREGLDEAVPPFVSVFTTLRMRCQNNWKRTSA